MKIAILGGGFTGLTAALRLLKEGHSVTILEKEDKLGGLAAGFKLPDWEWSLDYHYHHLFTSDIFARNLLKEIGKEDLLFFKRPKTAVFYEISNLKSQISKTQLKNQKYLVSKFDSPIDLLQFPHLSPTDKVRTGAALAILKASPFLPYFETVTAYNWLQKYMGKRAFKVLWEPLFVGKFGDFAPTISMAWFWARIKKRSSSLGYIKGGFQAYSDALGEEIRRLGGNIFLETTVLKIDKIGRDLLIDVVKDKRRSQEHYDAIICTLPTSIFLRLVNTLPADYRNKLSTINHIDALNLVLILDKPFFSDETYWLNINQTQFPFLAIVEHTNFMDKKHYGNKHIVYVGNYLKSDHPYFKLSKEELLKLFTPYLARFNQDFLKNLSDYRVFHGSNAQTIVPKHYSAMKPDFNTPRENLYLANLDMVYPWDRGTNYAIELGEKAAGLIGN